MNSVDEYIEAICDDFYRIFVRGENLDHRIGRVVPKATPSDAPVNSLGLDYETDVYEDEDNLLTPITG